MGVDFAVLSPEVNSGRMYAGPGSSSMLAAAAAWRRLASELAAVARGCESVVAGLTGEGWLGPAAEAMAAAVAPYVSWLAATAAAAEQTAVQLTAAAGAFGEAHAAVVPPAVIAANRSRLASLVAGNVLGQNSAEIAATEAQYAQMWVQDAAVMHGYALRSAAAAAVTPFAEPPATTGPAGSAGQAAAVAGASAGGAHTQLSQLFAAIPQLLQGISPAAASTAPLADGVGALQAGTLPSLTQLVAWIELAPKALLPFNDANIAILYGLVQYFRNINIDLDIAAASKAAAAVSAVSATGEIPVVPVGSAPVASGGIGNAGLVGKLSVPAGWMESAPEAKIAAAALPTATPSAAPAAAPPVPAGLFADMALASMVGRTLAGGSGRGSSPGPAAMMNGHAQGRLERMVNELAGTHEVQHWHVDPSRLDSLLEELSEKPGVHAVHVNDDGQNKPKLPPQQRSKNPPPSVGLT